MTGLLFVAGIGQIIVVTSAHVSGRDRLICTAILSAPFLLLAAANTWWILRARTIADGTGLRWRSFGRWHVARWDEVTDYHERRLPGKRTRHAVVETAAGNLVLSGLMTENEALHIRIAAFAQSARARGWGEKGTRPEDDWPRQFDYLSRHPAHFLLVVGGSFVLLGAIVVMLFAPKWVRLTGEIGWPLAVAALFLMLLVSFALPLAMLVAVYPSLRETRRRGSHSITVDLDGIQWRSAESAVAARWGDVTDYYVGPVPGPVRSMGVSVVVTRQGTFDFLHTLRDAAQLQEIIRRYAAAARTSEWREIETELLGGEASRWSSGVPGVGQRVFHYRTRTNRALLVFVWAHWVGGAIAYWNQPSPQSGGGNPGTYLGIGALLTVGLLWLTWRFVSAAVLVDHEGISQRAWNGNRCLRWTEVEGFWTSGADLFRFGNVVGHGKRIRFWLSVADQRELMGEVTTRAVHSKHRHWMNRELE